jgi:hypothetical protein
MEGRADQTYLVPFTHSQYEFIFSGAYVTVMFTRTNFESCLGS